MLMRNISYSYKICCKVIACPPRFIWNQQRQICEPSFEMCLLQFSNGTVDQTQFCKDLWNNPVNQNDPYWRDAKTNNTRDCFTVNNIQSCCYDVNYGGNTYGSYQPVNVFKRTIEQIAQQNVRITIKSSKEK